MTNVVPTYINFGAEAIIGQMHRIRLWLQMRHGTRQGDVYMSPIEWWINTGRASTPFLKAFCKADYHSIGRILEKGGADQEVVKKLLRLFHLDV